jgi:predicted alpha/beta-fold hydrolase
LFAFACLRPSPPIWTPERLELPDGDFVDLCHFGTGDRARVCLFHGLEGSVRSHYIGGLVRCLVQAGYRVTFMHFRGCSGEPNRLARAYHSGDTGDMGYVTATLQRREPGRALAGVGFSLGGNALLKHLGEWSGASPLSAAVAVSTPFELDACADRIDRGFARVYQRHLVDRMKRSTRARRARVGALPIDADAMARARSLRDFDEHVTAPLHGFADAQDYYDRASAAPWLPWIRIPTCLIQAFDDPLVGPDPVPAPTEVADETARDFSHHGGHVGFVAAGSSGRPQRWLDRRIPDWLTTLLAQARTR